MAIKELLLNLYSIGMKYTIDSKGKKMGRVAAEAASILMGKNSTLFARNVAPVVEVKIIGTNNIEISEKKLLQKRYARYSGYPGGLRYETLEHLISKKGKKEALRSMIYGMLPKNKLRSRMIKNLKIE